VRFRQEVQEVPRPDGRLKRVVPGCFGTRGRQPAKIEWRPQTSGCRLKRPVYGRAVNGLNVSACRKSPRILHRVERSIQGELAKDQQTNDAGRLRKEPHMNVHLRSCLFVLTVSVTAWFVVPLTASPARADSVPLTCKAGTNFKVDYISNTYNQNTGHYNGPGSLSISFTPGRGPATSGLSAGQCTLSNRSIKPISDPTNLCAVNPGVTVLYFNGSRLIKFDFANMPWASKLLSASGRIFVFEVHKAGCWVIDRVGP
jgi:hypothetical protein